EAVALYEEDSFQQNIDRIVQHRYSRYPFVASDGKVSGVVHIKDIFVELTKDSSFTDIQSLIRPVKQVPPNTHATQLFRKLQKGSPHFTVVAYKDSPPIGFITLDNLLSALVGDISDEFRPSQSEWTKLDDGSLLGKGTLPINTLERTLGMDIESEEADTVAGLVLWKLNELPEVGQRVEFDQFDVVIKKMSGPKVLLVRVYPKVQSLQLIASH
ncbi:MAG: transporter associated domain-containing protein, partial [Methylophilus sp.]